MFPFHTWLPALTLKRPLQEVSSLPVCSSRWGHTGLVFLPSRNSKGKCLFRSLLVLSIAIIYGGFVCLSQTDMKKLIAYSSVAHMGFATLGIFSLTLFGFQGALLQMLNHGVTTGALFLCVGIVYGDPQ